MDSDLAAVTIVSSTVNRLRTLPVLFHRHCALDIPARGLMVRNPSTPSNKSSLRKPLTVWVTAAVAAHGDKSNILPDASWVPNVLRILNGLNLFHKRQQSARSSPLLQIRCNDDRFDEAV